jgi:hypothetical protein
MGRKFRIGLGGMVAGGIAGCPVPPEAQDKLSRAAENIRAVRGALEFFDKTDFNFAIPNRTISGIIDAPIGAAEFIIMI